MTIIAITGAAGFIGLHTVLAASRRDGLQIRPIDRVTFGDDDLLAAALDGADVVIHLAGQNRGEPAEIEAANVVLAERLVDALPEGSATPVVYASTTQRHLDNPYGRSKRAAEDVFSASDSVSLTVAEITNVFGPGCRPHYNSVVATFCHLLTHDGTPEVHEDRELELIWVVDLADALVDLAVADARPDHVAPGPTHFTSVAQVLETLTGFRDLHFGEHQAPKLPDVLSGHLYRMLVTYADPADHAYAPPMFSDDRGYLFECVKQWSEGGQVFFSTTKPGIERGNHYHTRKYEKFCVLSGSAEIRLRRMGTDELLAYPVTGAEPTVVDIPLFHTHSIVNTGSDELLTLFWANEVFDHDDSDTFYEQVLP
jgi:UDP-2-acetamido-2,6-beta-L-arabino-hexul-4-ose reductase